MPVRNLAQRSAAAAKEIKELIAASVERVENGTALVDRAGQTMGHVVQSIDRVKVLIGEISATSSEQSRGITQINEAVAQLDQATQQNAALVEESAAAAASLNKQANELLDAVAFFQVDTTASPVAVLSRELASVPANASAVVPTTSQPANWTGVERRGPNRAANVVRPAFRVNAAGAATANRSATLSAKTSNRRAARAATGTDGDDWSSF